MLYDLSSFGLIKIKGNDAYKLLQGQLTGDVNEVTNNKSLLTALCNPQGRVINLFYIFYFQDAYFLIMQQNLIPLTLAVLKKYAIFYRIELSDVSTLFFILGYTDNNNLIDIHTNIASIKIPDIAGSRYILVAHKHDQPDILKLFSNETQQSLNDWNYLNILNNIPSIHLETTGKFLPHDLNLHKLNAISFTKGCFTGQEIIARMHYRAKLKKHLYQANYTTTESPPIPGETIYSAKLNQEPQENGVIVDICNKEYNQYYLLIITEEEHAKNDHLFVIISPKNYLTFA